MSDDDECPRCGATASTFDRSAALPVAYKELSRLENEVKRLTRELNEAASWFDKFIGKGPCYQEIDDGSGRDDRPGDKVCVWCGTHWDGACEDEDCAFRRAIDLRERFRQPRKPGKEESRG